MPEFQSMGPSILLPPTAPVIDAANQAKEAVDTFTSGKVIEDALRDNIILPLRDTAVKFMLIYLGSAFVLVGLILLAINTSSGKKIVTVATKGGISGGKNGD